MHEPTVSRLGLWLNRRRLRKMLVPGAVLAVSFLAPPASAQIENPDPVAIVSAASCVATVAPDSLASIFGTHLSKSVVQATLDSHGQLPTELDGTIVEVNGRVAPLIFVSPTQINCLIPRDADIGIAEVAVKSTSLGYVSRGTVPVRTVAPGIFSLDASGKGRGAVLNAVTYQLDPFAVETPANPGEDKKTRLAVYATGVRFAGNPRRDPSVANVASSIRAEMRDSTGKLWSLTVEYAGPAPGFFGLDQVNAVLPKEADGAGPVTLTLYAESASSNNVTFTVRGSDPPRIFSFWPPSAPPGAGLTIAGAGFAVQQSGRVAARNRVVFEVKDGLELAVSPLQATTNTLGTFVPPIVIDSAGTWHQGPVRPCVEVDAQRSCSTQSLVIQPAVKSERPPGQLLRMVGRQLSDQAVGIADRLGDANLREAIRNSADSALKEFDGIISDALTGRPRSFTIKNIDDSEFTVIFDLDALSRAESLFTASTSTVNTVLPNDQRLTAHLGTVNTISCVLPQERDLQQLSRDLHSLNETAEEFSYLLIIPMVATAVAACIATTPALCPLSAVLAVASMLPVLEAAGAFLTFAPIFTEIAATTIRPTLLASIAASPGKVDVALGGTADFLALGTFVPRSSWSSFEQAVPQVIKEVVTRKFAPKSIGLERFLSWISGRLADMVLEYARNHMPSLPYREESRTIELGASSLSVQPEERANQFADVNLSCSGGTIDRSHVVGNIATQGEVANFTLIADKGNLLLLDPNAPPETTLSVTVGSLLPATLSTDRTSYQPGDIVAVFGRSFPSRTEVTTLWIDSAGVRQEFVTQTDGNGTFIFYVPLSLSATIGTYTVVSHGSHGSVRASALFSVGPIFLDTLSYAISTVAGKGGAFCDGPDSAFCGDGGPATAAALWAPAGVTVDPSGNLYIGVSGRVRRVSPEGILSTVAGGGTTLGDGGPAVGARLEHPAGLLVDRSGNLYIADSADNRIRKVTPAGVISTFAGTGAQFAEFRGDGGPATMANLMGSKGVAVDSVGNIYIADGGYHRVRKVDPSGVITTVAGNGRAGFGGDGGPATGAQLNEPSGVALDSTGNLYIADTANNRVRIVTPEGVISTLAGNGVCQIFTSCFSGDGGPARMAQLNRPYGVAVDAAGNLYIADTNNFRIRKVKPDGTIHTIAGTDGYVYNGDGPDATAATLGFPQYLAVDAFGNVYVSDGWNNRVRKLTPR